MKEDKRLIEWICLCKENDSLAQKNIYEAYKDRLFTICLRYGGSYAEAQDIMIEGWTKIFNNISSFEIKDNYVVPSFEAWISRIMVNTAINAYFVKKRRKELMNSIDEVSLDQTYSFSTEYKYTEEELLSTIERLTPSLRIVFNLFAVDEFSLREIGEMLGITEGSVQSAVHRARVKLKEYLKEIR